MYFCTKILIFRTDLPLRRYYAKCQNMWALIKLWSFSKHDTRKWNCWLRFDAVDLIPDITASFQLPDGVDVTIISNYPALPHLSQFLAQPRIYKTHELWSLQCWSLGGSVVDKLHSSVTLDIWSCRNVVDYCPLGSRFDSWHAYSAQFCDY